MCSRHIRMLEAQEERRRLREIFIAMMNAIWTDNDMALAERILMDNEATIPPDQFVLMTQDLHEEIAWWNEIHLGGPAVIPRSDLHRLALDGQNVHTKEVAQQTNDATSYLLSMVVPKGQDTLKEIETGWGKQETKTRRLVLKDVRKWYATKTCRTEDDFLYRKCLDGLWARIKASQHSEDLLQRLWEECTESLQMCCEGHVSRLCNVMVGFEEECKAPVSVGELLQQKMAAIAALDIRVEHKVGEAWVVFEELSIPMNQRIEWLEAF
jgi:hypothetical protein